VAGREHGIGPSGYEKERGHRRGEPGAPREGACTAARGPRTGKLRAVVATGQEKRKEGMALNQSANKPKKTKTSGKPLKREEGKPNFGAASA